MTNKNFKNEIIFHHRSKKPLVRKLLTKLYFYVEGAEYTDKVYYNKLIRQKLSQLLDFDNDDLPVEVTACGSCNKVWERYTVNKNKEHSYYILDTDFNMIHYYYKGKHATFGSDIDSYKIFTTCGYSIENYIIEDDIILLLSNQPQTKEQAEIKKLTNLKNDLDSFLENIIPVTIIQYICFVLYRDDVITNNFRNLLDNSIKKIIRRKCSDNIIEDIFNDIQKVLNSNSNSVFNCIYNFNNEIEKLKNNDKLDWKKYTRGKSILLFFKSYNDPRFNTEETLIGQLLTAKTPHRLKEYIQNIFEKDML